MHSYIALLRKDPHSDYGVDFPDLPGCVTAGRTPEEGRAMAGEALALHLEGMAEDREPIPLPTLLESVMADAANRNATPFLVS